MFNLNKTIEYELIVPDNRQKVLYLFNEYFAVKDKNTPLTSDYKSDLSSKPDIY